LVLGGTWFLGRRIAERLHERGDAVLVVHRGRAEPDQWIPVQHLHTDRHQLADHAQTIAEFAPDAVVDSCPLTGADVDAVLPVLPEVPTVVLSSQDVYAAFTGLRTGREVAAVPITEDSELRAERYPYRGLAVDVPDDYEKLDVEQRWLRRGTAAADDLRPTRLATPRRADPAAAAGAPSTHPHRRSQPALDPGPR
jgi:hypothetical protein